MSTVDSIKRKYKIKGPVAEALIKQILQCEGLIESAEKQMKQDATRKNKTTGEKTPYGFDRDRFGFLKPHPGTDIIKNAHNTIRACLKEIGLSVDASDSGKKVKELDLEDVINNRHLKKVP